MKTQAPNGSGWIDDKGYRRIGFGGTKPQEFEHRMVMEAAIGRSLRRGESVHHINGDRLDNRLENLQLRRGRHGKGQVAYCADCGSQHIEYRGIGDHQETLV